jgi:hypothetical protein
MEVKPRAVGSFQAKRGVRKTFSRLGNMSNGILTHPSLEFVCNSSPALSPRDTKLAV